MDHRTVTVGDVDLCLAEAGSGGRPLLLLHGFTGAKEDFTEWLDRLAELGWHAVAPDHRGHGCSSKPEAEDDYSLDILARDSVGLAATLGWDRFTLLGHSMGGMVAQVVALAVSDRLDALVLMDTAHGAVDAFEPEHAELAIEVVRGGGIDVLADAVAGRESPLDSPAHKRLIAERPGYAEYNELKLRASSPAMYAAVMRLIVLGIDDRLERLRTLPPDLSTLVIVGEQDEPFFASSHRMADAIPGAQLVVIPDAGHSPQFENPDAWWDALDQFLTKVPAR